MKRIVIYARPRRAVPLERCVLDFVHCRERVVIGGLGYPIKRGIVTGEGHPRIIDTESAKEIAAIEKEFDALLAKRRELLDAAWSRGTPVRRADIDGR